MSTCFVNKNKLEKFLFYRNIVKPTNIYLTQWKGFIDNSVEEVSGFVSTYTESFMLGVQHIGCDVWKAIGRIYHPKTAIYCNTRCSHDTVWSRLVEITWSFFEVLTYLFVVIVQRLVLILVVLLQWMYQMIPVASQVPIVLELLLEIYW